MFECTEMTLLVPRASHRPCCDERELEASHTLTSNFVISRCRLSFCAEPSLNCHVSTCTAVSVHHISICVTSLAMMTACSFTRLHTIQDCCLIQMQMTMEQGPSTIPPALPVAVRAACVTCPAT